MAEQAYSGDDPAIASVVSNHQVEESLVTESRRLVQIAMRNIYIGRLVDEQERLVSKGEN